MNDRERFLRTMRYEPVDHRPLYLTWYWYDTLARWHREGLPADVDDVHAYLGVQAFRFINITGINAACPPFEERVLEEGENYTIRMDSNGCKVRMFKDHTSMPEWIDVSVKTPADLRRFMDERFHLDNLEARYTPEWEKRFQGALRVQEDAIILHDAGCYYGILHDLAGVEHASYLLYDAPELVEELFERYCEIVMYGLRRLTPRIRVDLAGFGEDLACRNGPMISPEMFRRLIVPRYRRAMDFLHDRGVDLGWCDSDGDVRPLLPDFLSVGINLHWPCEIASGMDPVALRKTYGKELRMLGGFDKRIVAQGKAAIDAEFARLRPVIEEGGFLPAIDHSVPASISWDNYRHFIDALKKSQSYCCPGTR